LEQIPFRVDNPHIALDGLDTDRAVRLSVNDEMVDAGLWPGTQETG
jgi:hypothetical protein